MGSILDLIDWRKWRRVSGVYVGTYTNRPLPEEAAMQLDAVWGCVSLRQNLVGTLPLNVHLQADDGSSEVAWDHRLQPILHDRPNIEFTAPRFWSATVASLDLQGDAFLEKMHNTGGDLVALNWLVAGGWAMHVERNRDTGALVYRYNDPVQRRTREIAESDIVHIRGSNHGGERGISKIRQGAKSLGIARDADEAAARHFANGIRPSGWLKTKRSLTDPQKDDLRKNLLEPMQGIEGVGAWGILEHDFEWQTISINPEDSQLLESRRFSIESICRWFDNTPPIMIGHIARGATAWGTGVQEMVLQYLITSVAPLCVRIERQLEIDLLTAVERAEGYVIKFNTAAMLRATLEAQANYLTTLTDHGLMSINEARSKLNLGKVPGGNKYRMQAQMVSIDPKDEAEALERNKAQMQPARPIPAPANDRKEAA